MRVRDIRNRFEHEEEENCCKPVRVNNFWSNNYIEYESKGDRNKTLWDKGITYSVFYKKSNHLIL